MEDSAICVPGRNQSSRLPGMAKVGVGDQAPEFELAGTGGRVHRLSDYRGKWVILAFYPGDFTPVCTRQFCSYRDGDDRLDQLGAEVLGISPQSVESHERFMAKHDLTVPLLADQAREAIGAYGVGAPGGLVRRSIFIIDPDGVVRYRHMALLGLHYKDWSDLSQALEVARR
jgi:thioredoxin-dependent peroxiredoxin